MIGALRVLESDSKEQKHEVKQNPIVSRRYEAVGEQPIGRGTWGEVWKIRDYETGETLAAKVLAPTDIALRQMIERSLNPRQILLKEGSFTPSNRIVPRRFEVDDMGTPFIVMPLYKQSLAERINKDGWDETLSVNYGLPKEKVLIWLKDMAEGIAEFHKIRKMAHSDLKLDNFLLDENDRAYLNDLGTATCASVDMRSQSPRGNMGFESTRAPECFCPAGHPDYKSDVYAFGSLVTRLFTGNYLLGSELSNAKDKRLFFQQFGEKGIESLIRNQLKNAKLPGSIRKFIQRCTRFDPEKRYSNGEEMLNGLNDTIKSMDSWGSFANFARKAMVVSLPALVLGLLGYKAHVHEPQELHMPIVSVRGQLSLQQNPGGKIIEFDAEKLKDLPDTLSIPRDSMLDTYAKQSTDNRVIAYLARCHFQAARSSRCGAPGFTNYQARIWAVYTIPGEKEAFYPSHDWAVTSKSIEVALTQSSTKDGKVDLEDVCALTRLGPEKIMQAKRIARSEDWKDYQSAKHSNGSYVLDRAEVNFVNQWLAYIHADTL